MNRLSIPSLLAGILLAGFTFASIAAPTTLEIFEKIDAGAGGTVTPLVAAERSRLLSKLDTYEEETFTSAPYEVEDDGTGTLLPKPLSGPIDAFGRTDALTLADTVSRRYRIDDPATAGTPTDLAWTGRFDTSSPDCTPAAGDCRWFETNGNFSIDFGGDFSGFGFYATDVADFQGSLRLQLILSSGAVVDDLDELDFTASADGGILFYGFFDTANTYSGVNFLLSSPGSSDYFGFDNLILGTASTSTPMPEPGSLALVGLSLLGLAATRRRRA